MPSPVGCSTGVKRREMTDSSILSQCDNLRTPNADRDGSGLDGNDVILMLVMGHFGASSRH